MFPSGRQDRNSLSPIVHVSSLFASRDLSFLLCLPTRNSTTLVAWRIVAPLIVWRTIYRVTCYNANNKRCYHFIRRYIYIIECEMISIVESWDGGGGSIIYLILRDWKRRWNICGDQIKWWSKDTFYISTYVIFPRVTKIYSFIFKSIWEYSINYCKYYSCFFLYF